MPKVSCIIPAGENEQFLTHTAIDLIKKASGDVEVIAVLDSWWPDPPLPDYPNLKIIHRSTRMGMRASINAGAAIATGDYLLKCDAHCLFAEGYDELLSADCDDNWVVIPRRFSLDAENWAIENNRKPPRDYHYLCYPGWDKPHDAGMHGVEWPERGKQRSDPQYDIDDNMSCQGSCWFMPKKHFANFLGGLSEVGYGTFTQEFQEVGNKTWLGGGAVKINKKTWYAHLHKGSRYGRMWHMSRKDHDEVVAGHGWSARYWMTNQWEGRVHDFEWLIEKFWPVPTWGNNMEEAFRKWHEHYGI
jgi:glycosyltransferase involved in cell wall biosynthesis